MSWITFVFRGSQPWKARCYINISKTRGSAQLGMHSSLHKAGMTDKSSFTLSKEGKAEIYL